MRWQIGDTATFSKTITESDIYLYAGITGDFNPAHVNEVWAKDTKFGARIAHGMLSAGLISTVLGMRLPGPGTIYLEQSLKFLAPVYVGDTVTAIVEVTGLIDNKRLQLSTNVTNNQGIRVIEGKALVLPPRD